MNLRSCRLAAVLGLVLGSPALAGTPESPVKDTFFIVPHTHWEGAVFKTREEYLEDGLRTILHAMRLLKEQPTYHYTLDQVAYVRPFLERYPEEEAAFRRYLAEGRLQLVGALDVMPDVNMPGGETFIRQMLYGKGYYRAKLGVDVTALWQIDTFGHHGQLPQLLALGGYKSFWFVRGVPKQEHPTEFYWEGIDGTRIPAYYLPETYVLFYPTPKDPAQFRTFARQRFHLIDANARGSHNRVGLSGADVTEPEDHQAPLVEAFNRAGDGSLALRMAVPRDYEAAVPPRADWPVFKGELNPIFQGTYSSRIELKQRMRSMEQRLLLAESLSTLAAWLGTPADRTTLWRAWEPVLFNETHDLASGVMTDHVYDDTVSSFEFSRRLADEVADARWQTLATRVDTRGQGTPVVVFNSLGWPRTDIAEVEIGFDQGGVAGLVLSDETGAVVPSQVLDATKYADGGLKTARVAFVARDVPAVGYRTYHAVPGPAAPAALAVTGNVLENALYRVAVDPATGAITSVTVKSDGWQVLGKPGNVVTRQQDRGDLWELYHGLDGASRVAMTTRQPVPARGSAAFSDEEKGAPGTFRRGPVVSELSVSHKFGTGQFATRLRVYEGLRRIDIDTRLVNNEKYVRYQALFPTSIVAGKSFHEIPFGAIERPDAIEFPAQNWVDHSDGRHGLALLNNGLPGNVVSGGTMMVSLLRSHTLGAYGFGGGYEPGMSSESGFQLGREITLKYALVPHAGDWRTAGVFRDGLEFNQPLVTRKVAPHAGPLPPRWGMMDVSASNVVVSALRPGRDGASILRVYEATGKATPRVSVAFHARVRSAREVNLMEDPGKTLDVAADRVQFDLHPFEIKTVSVTLGGL